MRVIIVEPNAWVHLKEVDGFEGIRKELDGAFLEVVPVGKDFVLYVDEDGIAKGLPRNRKASILATHMLAKMGRRLLPGDFIKGVAVFVGTQDGPEGAEECDLPESVIREYFPEGERT